MQKRNILYSDAEAWLKHDEDAKHLMRDKKDPEWANNRKLAWRWFAMDNLLNPGVEDKGPTINVQKMISVLEKEGVSKNKIDWAKTLFKLIPVDQQSLYNYAPFDSYQQLMSYLHSKVVVSKAHYLEKQMQQEYTEKERQNYISKRHLQKLFEGWLRRHNDALFHGSDKDPVILALRRTCLLGCLLLLNGPVRRREYLWLQSQKNESKTEKDKPQNYIKDGDLIVLEKYKTVARYGPFTKQIQDPFTLRIIDKIVLSDIWNRERAENSEETKYYLFNPRAQLTPQFQHAFEQITEAREGGPLSLNPNLLRKIDVEHYYLTGRLDSIEGRAWLAKCHGNDPSTQLMFYSKNHGEIEPIMEEESDSDTSDDEPDNKVQKVEPKVVEKVEPSEPVTGTHKKSPPLSAQSIRLVDYLARSFSNQSYIRWNDLYLRQDLFEGRKLGEVFAEIGGKEMKHSQRVRKIRHYLDTSPTWNTEQEILELKEDALERALKSKTKKRLYSLRKSLNLRDD
jgi:hypothetical protein